MRTFEEKKQCECWTGRKLEMCCIQKDLPCSAGSCISRRYHKNHPQLEWHEKNAQAALERVGLVDQYAEEMS